MFIPTFSCGFASKVVYPLSQIPGIQKVQKNLNFESETECEKKREKKEAEPKRDVSCKSDKIFKKYCMKIKPYQNSV